jgi:hypothetical protein
MDLTMDFDPMLLSMPLSMDEGDCFQDLGSPSGGLEPAPITQQGFINVVNKIDGLSQDLTTHREDILIALSELGVAQVMQQAVPQADIFAPDPISWNGNHQWMSTKSIDLSPAQLGPMMSIFPSEFEPSKIAYRHQHARGPIAVVSPLPLVIDLINE